MSVESAWQVGPEQAVDSRHEPAEGIGVGTHFAVRLWSAARTMAVPGAIMLLALVLRTYRSTLVTANFDTFEQLTATRRLLSGQFPISEIYPPGVALIMAVPMSVLPRTMATMQATVLVCSLLLVVLSYWLVKRTTGDHLAAALMSFAIATSPLIVFYSRIILFDVINALALVVAVFLVPMLKGRNLAAFIAYGAFIAILFNIRQTNVVIAPALILLWINPSWREPNVRAVLAKIRLHELIVTATSLIAVGLLLASIGGAFGQASNASASFTASGYIKRLLLYTSFTLGDFSLPVVLPLLALGARSLWKGHRNLVLASLYVLLVWPLVHAPFPFQAVRYMVPALCFAIFLSAHGGSTLIRHRRTWKGAGVVGTGMGLFLAIYLVAWNGLLLSNWSFFAPSDEALYGELRPLMAALPEGTVVIGGHTRAVRDAAPQNVYVDFVDLASQGRSEDARVAELLHRVGTGLADGRAVYYLYASGDEQWEGWTPGPPWGDYYRSTRVRYEMEKVYEDTVTGFWLFRIRAPLN